MEYAYYPGCSLEHTGQPYDSSIRSISKALGVGLREIEDWNCCGATMYMSSKKTVGYALSARNLALAAAQGLQVCAPCSSCYTILRKTNRHMRHDPANMERINTALAAAGMSYQADVKVRHPLDILVNDIGIETIGTASVKKLDGFKVAPYYGCQVVRPHKDFDDINEPTTLDDLLRRLGAEVVDYPSKVRCCGGMLMMTSNEVALDLNYHLMKCAEASGANIIATACPLCQLNLEAYQKDVNKRHGDSLQFPVVYFSQLVGLALGLSHEELGLDQLLVPLDKMQTGDAPCGPCGSEKVKAGAS